MGSDNEGKMKANGMPAMDANQTGGSRLPVRNESHPPVNLNLLRTCLRRSNVCARQGSIFQPCGVRPLTVAL